MMAESRKSSVGVAAIKKTGVSTCVSGAAGT